MGTQKDSERTRARFIEAAGPLFAERGYKGVTVRDIAREAESQPGALNYHFRSKESLYREALLAACREASLTSEEQAQLLALEPRAALRTFVLEVLRAYRDQGGRSWHAELLMRECWEPSLAFDEAVRVYFKPQAEFVVKLVARVVGEPFDPAAGQLGELALLGLLESFGLFGRYVEAVSPELAERARDEEWLVERIVHVVLAAASSVQKA